MALLVSILAKMDAGQAKAELRALQAALDEGKTGIAGLGDASDRVGPRLANQARQAKTVAESHDVAAGSTANLTANLNDVFMMIAAGQNPMQLAMQQGTQLTQVLGPMGAAGAAKAMGAALLSALNPFNFAVLGAIAGGAALVQWLTSAGEKSQTLAEALGRVSASLSDTNDLAKIAAGEFDSLLSAYGRLTPEIMDLVAAQKQIGLRELSDAAKDLNSQLLAMYNGNAWMNVSRAEDLANGLDLGTKSSRFFATALNDLSRTETLDGQLTKVKALREEFVAAVGPTGQMTSAQFEFYQALVDSESALQRVKERTTELTAATVAQMAASREAEVMGGNGRQGAMKVADGKQPRFNAEDLADARQMLATLQEEAALRDLINIKGRDSAAVALARAEAERAAYAEQVKSLEVAGPLKDELMAAWDAANGIARARIAAAIEAALGPASRLRGILGDAMTSLRGIATRMAAQQQLDQMAIEFSPGGQALSAYGSRAPGRTAEQSALESRNTTRTAGGLGAGGGVGGAGAAKAEADAVAELVARLREENEAIQVLDPVQAEMLKHRKVLKDATEAERAEVERLVESNQRLKSVQQAAQYASNTVGEFLQGIIVRGQSAGDVLRNLAAQFLAMAANSFITGQGWFAQLLGISGPLFKPTVNLADGGSPAGMVLGAGGPRDDMIDARLSAGEFVMNARATQRYRPVLERMNSGNVPGFANGGAVGRGAASPSETGPSGLVINVAVNGATGNEELGRMVRQGIELGLREFSSQVLPGRVQQVLKNPRIVGV